MNHHLIDGDSVIVHKMAASAFQQQLELLPSKALGQGISRALSYVLTVGGICNGAGFGLLFDGGHRNDSPGWLTVQVG